MEKIGSRMGGTRDFLGRPLPLDRKIVFNRLQKHTFPLNNDRSFEFKEELERLRSVMGIPKPCVEQALEIYKQAIKKEISVSIEALAAAALYMACRMMKMPRPLDEFVRYTKTSREKVARYYRLLLQKLDVKVPVDAPTLYVSRIAGQLGLNGEVVKTAIEILQKAKKAKITAGKDPAGLAAAAVYIAALMHGHVVTQKDLAAAAGVATITVRNRYAELVKIILRRIRRDDFKKIEVNGKTYVVKVVGGRAEFDEGRGGRKLLRIKLTAVVGGVRSEYTITFGRYGRDNATVGRAYARADAPGGREADAERLVAVIKALTGKKPKVIRRSDGKIEIACTRAHLEGFRRYAELADAIEEWLRQ
jgi:transcription initiation factor TFIIIB Brf1 subunit/transcription initiation factor TFIIB